MFSRKDEFISFVLVILTQMNPTFIAANIDTKLFKTNSFLLEDQALVSEYFVSFMFYPNLKRDFLAVVNKR